MMKRIIYKTHREDERGNVFTVLYNYRVFFDGKNFLIPAGFESDGASVPRFFWRIVCPPLDHRAVRAGVAHDYIYRTQPEDWTRREADLMFLAFLIEDGLPPFRARLAYLGVRFFGRRAWNANAEEAAEQ